MDNEQYSQLCLRRISKPYIFSPTVISNNVSSKKADEFR